MYCNIAVHECDVAVWSILVLKRYIPQRRPLLLHRLSTENVKSAVVSGRRSPRLQYTHGVLTLSDPQ